MRSSPINVSDAIERRKKKISRIWPRKNIVVKGDLGAKYVMDSIRPSRGVTKGICHEISRAKSYNR